ncbi:hypothetical protein PCASD_11500 [Puccinia coronata f. sp. avenae]|uniref:Uncharacterized protein n=1 Tax=Puccinia coronata f. sp. avenae TaxID=200324 RepID=A0A2N5V3B8_9BASI|nr:hypothetical protein PCASD_11500 [Puccinia coronata f. sp. avenae]
MARTSCLKNNIESSALSKRTTAAVTSKSCTNSATLRLNNPDSLMSAQQTDPTLDLLERQFPQTQSQSMMDMNDLFGLDKVFNQDKGPSLPPEESPAASCSAVLNSTTPAPPSIENKNPVPHSSLLPMETETSLGPRAPLDIRSADPSSKEVKAMTSTLDCQWNLFMKAWAANNFGLMRATLMQAHTSQLILQSMVGLKQMMTLSHQWSAKNELDKLETLKSSMTQTSPMRVDYEATRSLQVPNQSNQTVEDICYLKTIPGGSFMPNACLPPPPPLTAPSQLNNLASTIPPLENLQPSVLGQANPYPPLTQSVNDNFIPPHHLGYPYNTYHTQPEYNHQRDYYPQNGYPPQADYRQQTSHQHRHYTPYACPGNNQNRGRGRNNNNNNRRNRDSTFNMMEIGNFFVRAERALNAIQRRGQGRGSQRQGRGQNQPAAYPHLPPQRVTLLRREMTLVLLPPMLKRCSITLITNSFQKLLF